MISTCSEADTIQLKHSYMILECHQNTRFSDNKDRTLSTSMLSELRRSLQDWTSEACISKSFQVSILYINNRRRCTTSNCLISATIVFICCGMYKMIEVYSWTCISLNKTLPCHSAPMHSISKQHKHRTTEPFGRHPPSISSAAIHVVLHQ